ncbi:hypothetical protein F5X98DRAFT_93548 [Xylaria grammica]|nr:hypothetical protein F5X98DRAFT_93548 [Xylaria grammica]
MAGRSGWNPYYGWDGEGAGPAATTVHNYANGIPNMPYGGGLGMNSMMNTGAYGLQAAYQAAGLPQAQLPAQTPGYMWPQYGYQGGNAYDPYQRLPQPHPRVSLDVPGMNMVNSTGGAGCEPGYNYIFHDEHTKIHVFKTTEPPWRAPLMNYSFSKFQVPTNTKISELMLRFGACNPVPQLNRITEVIEGGNGLWYRGMIFQGDQEFDCQKTLKECGWDSTRSGREKAVVWLWITKD